MDDCEGRSVALRMAQALHILIRMLFPCVHMCETHQSVHLKSVLLVLCK